MMRRPLIYLSLIAVLLTAGWGPVDASRGPSRFVRGEVLARFQPDVTPEIAATLAGDHRAQAVGSIPRLGIWRLRVEPGREWAIARSLGELPQVLYAEPNYVAWALVEPPDDPLYVLQWNLDKVQAPDAWQITRGDPSMPIAIIDTGIDLGHPDLAGKLWVNVGEIPGNGLDDDGNGYIDDVHGYDFVNRDGEPADDHGHGTHVSGIAGAATGNGLGVAGMAPANPLMVLKVMDHNGEGDYAGVAEAISYALAAGARVMNLSLGGIDASDTLSDAAKAATAEGAILVAAAGNCGTGCTIDGQSYVNPWFYPAAYEEVLAVGATDRNDAIASFSEHHPYVDVAAPGVSVYSTYRRGSYGYMNGTSMATPHASGLAALVWAGDTSLTPEDVMERIVETAEDLGPAGKDDYYGWGRINARSALCAAGAPLSVTPSTLTFMADAQSLSVPGYGTVQIANSGCLPLTWSVAISPPSAGWVRVTPTSGTLEQGGSQPLRVDVDPAELGEAYGDYASQIQLLSPEKAVVGISLHYVPQIYQLIFLAVYKDAPLAVLSPTHHP